MAASERKVINIRYNSSNPISIEADPKWDIRRLKREIAGRLRIPQQEVRIIFQGRELADIMKLEHCDLGNGSILNAIKGRQALTLDAERKAPLENLAEMGESLAEEATDPSPGAAQAQFYVYCKRPCKGLQPGKIRVWCKTCQHGAFEVQRDPECFDDVIEPNRIGGVCHNKHCNGKKAEFYFKCKSHEAGEFDTASPLTLVRSNIYSVPCAVCFEEDNPVLVFPCTKLHVMCVPCFADYCTVKLNERSFVQNAEAGYTVPCPGTDDGCNKAYVMEGHHFRLMGNEQFDRYNSFATEEFVLQNGGVLCPQAGCGAGILPENPSQRKVTCEKQGSHGCGFEFCRRCQEAYHMGECGADKTPKKTRTPRDLFRLNSGNAQRARWDQEARAVVREISKPCPNCNVPIEKNAGCMHMTCARCKFGWCWICRIEWNGKCQGDHWFGE